MATGKIFKHFMWIVAIYQALGHVRMSSMQHGQCCFFLNLILLQPSQFHTFHPRHYSNRSICMSKKSRVVGEGFVGKIKILNQEDTK